jgi:16S rRNA processing protein RimM
VSLATNNKVIVLGFIKSAYGIKGWVKVKSFTSPETNILQYPVWKLNKKGVVSKVSIEKTMNHQTAIAVKFHGCNDRDRALLYSGSEISVDVNDLPSLEEDYVYYHQLEGLKVYYLRLENSNFLGIVSHMFDTAANQVIVIKPTNDSLDKRERLIPWIMDQVVISIDLNSKIVIVDWDPDF